MMLRYILAFLIGIAKIAIVVTVTISVCLLLELALEHIPYIGVISVSIALTIMVIITICMAISTGMDTLNQLDFKKQIKEADTDVLPNN